EDQQEKAENKIHHPFNISLVHSFQTPLENFKILTAKLLSSNLLQIPPGQYLPIKVCLGIAIAIHPHFLQQFFLPYYFPYSVIHFHGVFGFYVDPTVCRFNKIPRYPIDGEQYRLLTGHVIECL